MKNIRVFYLNIFQLLEVKFSIYLNRRVFVMIRNISCYFSVGNLEPRHWGCAYLI